MSRRYPSGGTVEMPSQHDYYEILNIPTSADQDLIKKTYKALALKYHPDKASAITLVEAANNPQKSFPVVSQSRTLF